MKLQNLSVRAFLRKIVAGTLLTAALLLLIFFLLTKDVRVVICGIILTAAFYIWGMVFLHYFQKKLSLFTDGLCQTLDHMMDSTDRPQVDYEAETLLSRISHRLERLYNVMQKTRHTAEGEKEELQSLVSDISHQTKTPIANLKLLNDTMLTRPLTEEKRKEFLQATGTQLDKLDFLIQGMVKTSRLETGVITLEKQDAVIGDTLVSAINGVLAPMEQKEINLSVDCPSDLTISHDSRWTSEALFNILDNAVKYTSAGGSIQVRVRDWEMYLRIDVTDTGRGIPEHSQGTIFKRFYRDEAVHDIDGVGIGLYLAREIITMQGGYITAESKVGEGSTFSVFLPIK
ncbi:HAMP domain-containing histidine kinase [Anaerosacchariphilus sp. NSJ-68]|jgi:signal transduction histidine kinase|uniref:histidine kinase n=2 Tax=Lachnospiraceae TaxID=186803 RepID=A0A923RLH2_9FIRM|nr:MULTISPECIES: HAMP domain-containing sensor histidine kinase [Lachnospiraceae]MBC5658346.1 HAMP domain-containing histidine kinase [Anaerosacchariphilus hominis]MBC5698446.1 HAMP domain-containing histidine kinase [Roseburia difficilis]